MDDAFRAWTQSWFEASRPERPGQERFERMLKKTIEEVTSWFSMTDEQAMWRARQGADLHAFGVLVERWRQRIHSLCLRMTGCPHRAEDLTQEVFIRIFDRRQAYDPAQRFSSWLWRIALNICYDDLRRVQRRRELPLEEDAGEGGTVVRLEVVDSATPHDRLQQREEAELVRNALLQLPEIYRTVLVLRHYENLKLREIADVLEIPDGTVNSRMAEGLAQLTRLLEPEFGKKSARQPRERGSISPKELLAL